MNRVLRRWVPLLAVGLLVAAAWLASTLATPQIDGAPVSPLRPASTSGEAASPSASSSGSASAPTSLAEDVTEVDTPDERTGLVVVIGLILVLGVVGIIGWIVVRRRVAAAKDEPVVVVRKVAPKPAEQSRKTIVEAVDAGISDLFDAEAEPRVAVIACWVRLERAAAEVGTPRQVGDSPTDLVARLLYAHRVSPQTLDGLAAVYRESRYARHVIDENMRVSAVQALRQLRAELGGELAAVGATGSLSRRREG